MDPRRFDTLVRSLTTGGSRRRLLGVLSVLPLVGTALTDRDEDAAAAKGKGRHTRHGKRQDTERELQRTAPETQSCAKRCRKKPSKQARRRCRKRCAPSTPECTTSQDCPAGELCESGICLPITDQCTVDSDCDACEQCADGVCEAQCQPDEVCRDTQCESVQCTVNADCGDCSRCVEGRCRWQCAVTEVCLSGAGGRCCPPRSCPSGLDCGTVDDGCGRQVRCGPDTCSGTGQACGGGGNPNVCGCVPITTCPADTTCGTIPNGCGGYARCGPDTCPQPADPCQQAICQANVCTTVPGHDGASCGTVSCTAGTSTPPGTCRGGTCQAASPVPCDPYLCDGDICASSCRRDDDCVGTAYCNAAQQCVGDQDNGQPCTHGGQCQSGFCTEGVCCSSAACDACRSCVVSGQEGTCQPTPSGTACGTDTCSACDGVGTCVGCSPGQACCDDVCKVLPGGDCAAGGDADCCSGICIDGVCAAACNGENGPCDSAADCCAGTSCVPGGGTGVCCASGIACGSSCCAKADQVCDPDGACCTRDDEATTCAGRCGRVLDNCGVAVECGQPCAGGPAACCNTVCVDLTRDLTHCGRCATTCLDGTRGSPGCCTGQCTDLLSDVTNCGTCGVRCTTGTRPACCGGGCVDLATNVDHCGTCNTPCTPATVPHATAVACQTARCVATACEAGYTVAQGQCCEAARVCNPGPDATCCGPGERCCGNRCVDVSVDPNNCGGCNQQCPAGVTCAGSRCGQGAFGGICGEAGIDCVYEYQCGNDPRARPACIGGECCVPGGVSCFLQGTGVTIPVFGRCCCDQSLSCPSVGRCPG